MCSRSFRPFGLPIYVARVPAAPFSVLPASLYLDHSHFPVLAPATLAALPSTRAIPDRDVFYVARPTRSILLFPESFEQFAQARGRLIAIQPACGDIEHERFPIFDWQFLRREELVRFEKDQARRQRGPFIAVDERVITTKIKKISRGDLDWVGNQRTARHCRLGCGDRRLEQIFVAEARRTAVCGEN